MRLIRYKIDAKVERLLNPLNRKLGIEDPGLTEDLFILMRTKGQGIPTDGRLEKMIKFVAAKTKRPTSILGLLMKKRKMLLVKAVNNLYFRALWDKPDTVDALERFFILFRTVALRQRETTCMACQFLNQCDFGKQYGQHVADPMFVADPDFSKVAHPSCPSIPASQFAQQLAQGMAMMNQAAGMADEDEDEDTSQDPFAKMADPNNHGATIANAKQGSSGTPAGDDEYEYLDVEDNEADGLMGLAQERDGGKIISNSTGGFAGDKLIRAYESLANEMSKEKLLLFEIGKKFSMALSAQKKGKYKPVSHVDKNEKPELIKGLQDITKLTPSQHGLPEEIFDAKLHKRELTKQQNLAPEDKISIIYMLIDNSGSMGQQFKLNPRAILTRAALCQVFAIAVARRVKLDKGFVFCRFFSGMPTPLLTVCNDTEFQAFERKIADANFNGASTDIPRAVHTALTDISRAAKNIDLAKAEILLLTDCESDDFGRSFTKKDLQGIPLNILDLSGSSSGYNGGFKDQLRRLGTQYFKANENAQDLDKMVALV